MLFTLILTAIFGSQIVLSRSVSDEIFEVARLKRNLSEEKIRQIDENPREYPVNSTNPDVEILSTTTPDSSGLRARRDVVEETATFSTATDELVDVGSDNVAITATTKLPSTYPNVKAQQTTKAKPPTEKAKPSTSKALTTKPGTTTKGPGITIQTTTRLKASLLSILQQPIISGSFQVAANNGQMTTTTIPKAGSIFFPTN